MAYLTITRFHGDPDQLLAIYRRSAEVMDGVGRDHGLILHAAAGTDDGMLLVNLWPSQAESDAAAADPRRRGELERAMASIDALEREHHEVDRYVIEPI